MRYLLSLAVLILTLASNTLFCMTPIIKYPIKGDIRRVYWINKERAILQNEYSWILVDPTTGSTIKSQKLQGMQDIALHSYKPLFAASHEKTVSIHDTNMGNSKATLTITDSPGIMEATFNAHDLLFVRHEHSGLLTVYNYENDRSKSLHLYEFLRLDKHIINIASHPTQDQIALFTTKELLLMNTKDCTITKTIAMPDVPSLNAIRCKYNLDGSLITIQHGEKIHLVDPINDHRSIIPTPSKDYFEDCMFYPNNNTLVTISETDGTIHFWDVETLALLTTLKSGIKTNSYGRRIMLNFDEKDLIVSFKNKTFRIPVPFTIFQRINFPAHK